MDKYQSINDMWADICHRHYDKKAFTCLGRSLTFGDVDELSNQFASYLQHHTTLASGDRLAIQLPNILQYPVVIFGALKAGVIIVNVNPLYTAPELIHQLNDSGAKALVVLKNLAKVAESVIEQTNVQQVVLTEVADLHGFPKRQIINGVLRYVKKQVPQCSFPSAIDFRKALELGERDKATRVETALDDLCFLQYTGGTTGIAKGAMLSQRNLLANSHQILAEWADKLDQDNEQFLAPLPLYHIYGFNMHCLVLPATGAESFLIPNARDLDSVAKVLKSLPLTGIIGINTLYIALMNRPDFSAFKLDRLKTCSAGGMALSADTAKRWHEMTGVNVCEGYGLTETSPVVSSNSLNDVHLGTIGMPLVDTEVKTIDKDGRDLKQGEIGELCVRGPQVMMGYWKNEAATAEVLSPDGWFRTGDIALIDTEGYITIVDRQKDIVIVSGFNVYPNEIEGVLVSHSEVLEAAVVGVPDANSGEAVKAFIVRMPDSTIDDEALKAFCRNSLTAYKVPRFFEFRDELPKTNVGKVLRRALRTD